VIETKGKKSVVACTLSHDTTEYANARVIGIRVA